MTAHGVPTSPLAMTAPTASASTPVSWWRTAFGDAEIRRVAEAIRDEHVSQGAVTAEFERRLAECLGVPYVVATTSGSAALLMALLALDVKPGDEVIVPNRAWIAAAHAPLLLGARVVLVDVEPDRPVMDVRQMEQQMTPRTKAVIPVHLNGRSVAMDDLRRVASAHGVRVVEDAAQALCSRNAAGMLGCQSDVGCFSLSVAKLISTGQGGFVVTKDPNLYERLIAVRTHGVRDLIEVAYTQVGFNFRFTDLQASIGMAQLERLAERIASVKAIYARYTAALGELPFLRLIPVDVGGGELPLYVEVLCPERERLREFLASQGIQTRPFYPDLHRAGYLANPRTFPRSEVYGEQGLFLPCGPAQPFENIDRVLSILRRYHPAHAERVSETLRTHGQS